MELIVFFKKKNEHAIHTFHQNVKQTTYIWLMTVVTFELNSAVFPLLFFSFLFVQFFIECEIIAFLFIKMQKKY